MFLPDSLGSSPTEELWLLQSEVLLRAQVVSCGPRNVFDGGAQLPRCPVPDLVARQHVFGFDEAKLRLVGLRTFFAACLIPVNMKIPIFRAALGIGYTLAGSLVAEESPRLVVAVAIDQLRYDYMERFREQFSLGGLRRLSEEGCFLTSAMYDYVPTVTAPGHASLWSGANPSMHGIIANDWFDRRSGKMRYCVADESVQGVGTQTAAGRMSPRNFIGANFADEFRLRFGGRVVGISMKDRGAILPAGRRPSGAYWFESASGAFVTSSYYLADLPEWVRAFNARELPAGYSAKKWARLLPMDSYQWPDDQVGEGVLAGETKPVFEHALRCGEGEGYEAILPTPFGNELLVEFAKAALSGESLGKGSKPDLLCVSFSSLDYCGHRFGPYSQEVQDTVLRLDRQLEQFLNYLDEHVGRGRFIVALSADHGVAPTPEFAHAQGLAGGRFDPVELVGELSSKLSEQFGEGRILLTPRLVEGNLFLNHDLLREKRIAISEVVSFVREWALETGWFQACYSRDQILEGRVPGEIGARVLNGYNAERSGDLVLVSKPFALSGGQTSGTTHGSFYSYDAHVPILLYGPGFQSGRVVDPCRITDLVPTLCSALRMEVPPGCTGRPVAGALAVSPVPQNAAGQKKGSGQKKKGSN